MQDEVQVKFGADLTAFGSGLRSLKGQVEGAADHIKDSFSHAFEHIAGAVSVVGAIGLIEKTFEKVQGITRQSESLGVSTDFVQSIQNAGSASGIAAPKIERMLDIFVKGLPAGADVEEQFYKTADSIAAIEDPAERARIATDAFGKSGVQMVAVLAQGRDGVKELAAGFSQLSDVEIKAVEEAHVKIEQAQSTLTVWAGHFINTVQGVGKIIGAKLGGLDPQALFDDEAMEREKTEQGKKQAQEGAKAAAAAAQKRAEEEKTADAVKIYKDHLQDIQLKSKETSFQDKKAILENRYAQELAAAKASKTEIERVGHMSKMADLKQQVLDLEKKHTDELDKQHSKEEKERDAKKRAQQQVDTQQRNLNRAQRGPYEFSLEDLAGSNGFESGAARDVVQLREWAKWNFMHGNFGKGEFQKQRAEEIFGNLTKDNPYLKNPYEAIEDQLKRANDKLAGKLTVEIADEQ
jgi:hypothetical protein